MEKRNLSTAHSGHRSHHSLQIQKNQIEDINIRLTRIKVNHIPSDSLAIDYDIQAYFHQTKAYAIYELKKHDTHEKYTTLELKISKIDEFNFLERAITNSEKMVHHHLLSIKFYSHELFINENQKYWKFWILYEYYSVDLPALIMQRLTTDAKNFFNEQYLIQFCRDMISLFAFLKLFQFDHRPISPYNFVVSHSFMIKFNGINIGKFNLIHKDKDRTETPRDYLAPEELEAMPIQGKEKLKKEKAEVFTLGLIILFMATLNSIEGLNTNAERLRHKVKSLEKYYNQALINILSQMLEMNPARRPTFAELYTLTKRKIEINNNNAHNHSHNNSMIRQSKAEQSVIILDKDNPNNNGESSRPLHPQQHNNNYNSNRSKSSNHVEIAQYLMNNGIQVGGATRVEKDNGIASAIINNYPIMPTITKTNSNSSNSNSSSCLINSPLYISNLQPSILSIKMFHTFIPLTKKLIRIPIVDISSIYYEEIDLKINFLVPIGHRSCLTQCGKIYLFGVIMNNGNGSNNPNAITNTFLYNKDDNTLIEKTTMKSQRYNFSTCNYDSNSILVVGGHDATMNITNTCELYDIQKDQWINRAKMKTSCFNSLLCTFNSNYIYRIGGMTVNKQLCDNIERYNMELDKWSIIPLKRNPLVRFNILELSCGIQINQSHIFIFGGYDEGRQPKAQSYILNLKTLYTNDNDHGDNIKQKEEIIKINEHKIKNMKLEHYFYPDQILLNQKHIIALQDTTDAWRIIGINEQNEWLELKAFPKNSQPQCENPLRKSYGR